VVRDSANLFLMYSIALTTSATAATANNPFMLNIHANVAVKNATNENNRLNDMT
jgi:hypothetical protein